MTRFDARKHKRKQIYEVLYDLKSVYKFPVPYLADLASVDEATFYRWIPSNDKAGFETPPAECLLLLASGLAENDNNYVLWYALGLPPRAQIVVTGEPKHKANGIQDEINDGAMANGTLAFAHRTECPETIEKVGNDFVELGERCKVEAAELRAKQMRTGVEVRTRTNPKDLTTEPIPQGDGR